MLSRAQWTNQPDGFSIRWADFLFNVVVVSFDQAQERYEMLPFDQRGR